MSLHPQIASRGAKSNTEFISKSLGAAALTETGTVKILPTLQLVGHPNIFAAGDVIDWKEQKTSAKASPHGVLAAQNIINLINKKPLKEYKGAMELMVVTNGKVCCLAS